MSASLPLPVILPTTRNMRLGSKEVTSGACTRLQENPENWNGQIFEVFLRDHPWASRAGVRVELTRTSPDGYGVGYVLLTPKHVPATASSPESINVLSVPIVIDQFELMPLDTFIFQDKFIPLEESRALPLLQLPDVFHEADLDQPSSIMRWGDTSGGPSLRGMGEIGLKTSMPHLRQGVARELEGQGRVTPQDALEICAKVSSASGACLREDPEQVRSFLSQHPYAARWLSARVEDALRPKKESSAGPRPSLAFAEFHKGEDAYWMRDWWYRDPEDSRPKISGWSRVPYSRLRTVLSAAQSEALQRVGRVCGEGDLGEGVRGDFPEVALKASEAAAREQLHELEDRWWLDPAHHTPKHPLAKLSHALGGYPPSILLTFAHSGSVPLIPLQFKARLVYGPRLQLGSPGDFERVQATGFLTEEGYLCLIEDVWDFTTNGLFVFSHDTDGSVPTVLPAVKQIHACASLKTLFNQKPVNLMTTPSQAFVWLEEGAIHLVAVELSPETSDGTVELFAPVDSWTQNLPITGSLATLSRTGVRIAVGGGHRRTYFENSGGRTVLHIPEGHVRVPVGGPFTGHSPAPVSAPPAGKGQPGVGSPEASSGGRGAAAAFLSGSAPTEGSKSGIEQALFPDKLAKASAPRHHRSSAWGEGVLRGGSVDVGVLRVEQGLGQTLKVSHPLLQEVGQGDQDSSVPDAIMQLRFVGLSASQVEDVLGQVKISGEVEVEVEFPRACVSPRVRKEAHAMAKRMTSPKAESTLRQIRRVARGFLPALVDGLGGVPLGKVSSLMMGATVDAALGLGFLGTQTVLKFIDQLPALESCLGHLCALRISCRLGLTEVTEECVDLAITGLNGVLKGLKVLEALLKGGASS